MAFGIPEKVSTQFEDSEEVRVRSVQNPDFSYLFRRSKKPHEADSIFKSVWSCVSCEKLRKQDIRQQIQSSTKQIQNHAEGYHHALNLNEIAEVRPALRNFLAALQKSHNSQQQHVRKLINGITQPIPRNVLYANHAQIETEKRNFFDNCQNLWNFPQFDPGLLFMHNQEGFQFLCGRIEQFLRFMRYRIGDVDNVNGQNAA